jgi:hypothetical protein
MAWKKAALVAILTGNLLIGGCSSGGGDDDGSGSGGAGTESAGAGAAGVQNAIGSISVGLGAATQKPSFQAVKDARRRGLRASVKGLAETLQVQRQTISPLSDNPATPCDSGDFVLHSDSGYVSDMSITYNNCVFSDLDGEVTTNGVLAIAIGVTMQGCSDFQMTFTDYESHFVEPGVDEAFSASGYTMDMTDTSLVCDFSSLVISESGGFEFTDHLEANNSITMSGIDLSMTVTSDATGNTITVDGSFGCSTSCFNGTLTLATTTPLFFPASGGDCATAGEIVVTGTLTGTITYTSTGGVQIDEGSDGSVDEEYASCEDVEACVG